MRTRIHATFGRVGSVRGCRENKLVEACLIKNNVIYVQRLTKASRRFLRDPFLNILCALYRASGKVPVDVVKLFIRLPVRSVVAARATARLTRSRTSSSYDKNVEIRPLFCDKRSATMVRRYHSIAYRKVR